MDYAKQWRDNLKLGSFVMIQPYERAKPVLAIVSEAVFEHDPCVTVEYTDGCGIKHQERFSKETGIAEIQNRTGFSPFIFEPI